MSAKILVIDDELGIRASLKATLEEHSYATILAESGEAGLELLGGENHGIEAVLLDIWMPGIDGFETLRLIKETSPQLPVIMLSGHGSIDNAIKATKNGAYHFLEKPFGEESLLVTLGNALRLNQLERENVQLKRAASRNQHNIVGQSPPFRQLMEQTTLAAKSDAWVLIHGENGTGKESIAHTVHDKSPRHEGPFVEVNCAAIPEELIESELFGHEKGSFTGATARKIGKFDQAHQGTLFLDEIGDMSLKTQARILRVLQEQRFERVGGNKTIEVDVRVIAASNKRLDEEIAAGNFREDLYYRLNVLQLDVPPLRDRKGDVSLLVPFFLQYFADVHGHKQKTISSEALSLLEQYEWPGNIRELKNIVERMMIMVTGPEITLDHIPPVVLQAVGRVTTREKANGGEPLLDLEATYRQARDQFERAYLYAQLQRNGWNISRTAELIKLERSNLHKKIKQLKIEMG